MNPYEPNIALQAEPSSPPRKSLLRWPAIIVCALLSLLVFILVVSVLAWILSVPFWRFHPLQPVGAALSIGSMLLFSVGMAALSWGLLKQDRKTMKKGRVYVSISLFSYILSFVFAFAMNAMYPEMIKQGIEAIMRKE